MRLKRRQNLLNAERYMENPSLDTLAGILPMYLKMVKYHLDNRRSNKKITPRAIGYALSQVLYAWRAFVDLAGLGAEYHHLLKVVSYMAFGEEQMPIESIKDNIEEAYNRTFEKRYYNS